MRRATDSTHRRLGAQVIVFAIRVWRDLVFEVRPPFPPVSAYALRVRSRHTLPNCFWPSRSSEVTPVFQIDGSAIGRLTPCRTPRMLPCTLGVQFPSWAIRSVIGDVTYIYSPQDGAAVTAGASVVHTPNLFPVHGVDVYLLSTLIWLLKPVIAALTITTYRLFPVYPQDRANKLRVDTEVSGAWYDSDGRNDISHGHAILAKVPLSRHSSGGTGPIGPSATLPYGPIYTRFMDHSSVSLTLGAYPSGMDAADQVLMGQVDRRPAQAGPSAVTCAQMRCTYHR